MMTVTLQLHNQINAESDEVVIHKEEQYIDISILRLQNQFQM